jgi:hypothetical protein
MKRDEDITREFRGYFADCEPTADQLMAARARLEAHISQAPTRESTVRAGRVVVRGATRVRRFAWATLGALGRAVQVAVPLVAGILVLVLLLPAGGNDAFPPQCSSVYNYQVPCTPWLAFAAGAATAGIVGLALWLFRRRWRQHK